MGWNIYSKTNENSPIKKIIFILANLVFGLLFLTPQNMYSQETGFKYFKNYSYKEYEHQPQNWDMVQTSNGIIYVANNGGVLEYDGASWRVIGIPDYAPVRSLAIDETDTIYIGGMNKIGYLDPDSMGTLKYQSLVDHLEDNEKNFSNVWSTHVTKEGIYFMASKFLFCWDAKKISRWTTPNSFWTSFVCNGDLFVHEKNKGLLKMVNGSLQLLPGTETFAGDRIYLLVPYYKNNDRELIMGIRSKGFYLYDGKTAKPFFTEIDDYLKKNSLFHSIRLNSGDFALATLQGGIVIMDSNGGLKDIFNKSSDLQDDRIFRIFEDTQRNLWLCMENGITKIEYASPLSIYDDRSNLSGFVLSVVKHQRDLYVGTTNGLFQLGSSAKFQPIPGISSPCWALYSTGDSLLAATTKGVSLVKKNFVRKVVVGRAHYVFLPSRHHPGLTWCGTFEGLAVLPIEKGKRVKELRPVTVNQEIRSIAEDKNGNLWLGTVSGGIFKVDFPGDIQNPIVTHYNTHHGLPEGEITVALAAGHVVFASAKGLFRFDEKKNTITPDLTLGDEWAGKLGEEDSRPVFRIIEDENKHIWFHSESRNYQAIPDSDGTFKVYDQPFRRIPISAQVNAIYPAPDGKIIWFASQEGLIRYDKAVKKDYRQNFHVLIRKVVVNRKLIFDGYNPKTVNSTRHPISNIHYKDRKNFHFEFAAPFFEAETETKYRYLLEGHDDQWSDWSLETSKDFTTLESGIYAFRVQAKNVYGELGRESAFKFKILPPWYWTLWAFLIYLIALSVVVFFIVKWRSRKLELEKQKLELTVQERTKEIEEKNKQLKDQSEKLQEMDRVKSRFFANISHEFRTPLTLIMSPAEQMQAEVKNKHHKEQLETMLRNSQRLLILINQLLDLSKIDSGKLKLEASNQDIVSFLKGILASFYILTQQNQLALEFHPEEEEILLYFDSPKMEEVMHNLLINAVKFTAPGGKITVSVYRDQQEPATEGVKLKRFVNISVRDTGVGISHEQIAHIFDRFFQAKNLKIKSHKGTGIGLALAKEIVTLHHGTIDAHSREGEGTEFVIRLPMGRDHLKPDEIADPTAAPYKPQKEKKIENLYIKTETGKKTEQEKHRDKKEEGEENIDNEKTVILVVEDDADVRKYIRGPLVDSGYTVVEAGDGKEGIEKALEIIPDLIVSDIMMPEPDGYELCKTLKADINTSHVPIVLLTAKASEESIIQGLKTGADDYITKPFNSKILLTRIKNLIDLRNQLQLKLQRESLKIPSEIKVSSLDAQFLKKFKETIEANLSDEDFRIDDLCEKLGMGRANLFKKIKALTGETPNQFIVSYRIERGAQLLRENYGNVTNVAMAVGFGSSAYFTKCFKDKFHMSPSTYQASESKSESDPAESEVESS